MPCYSRRARIGGSASVERVCDTRRKLNRLVEILNCRVIILLLETALGAPIERVYTPEHVEHVDYVSDLGFPGEFPYTRGVQPTMYRPARTMRQYAGSPAEESNARYHYLLAGPDRALGRLRSAHAEGRIRTRWPRRGRARRLAVARGGQRASAETSVSVPNTWRAGASRDQPHHLRIILGHIAVVSGEGVEASVHLQRGYRSIEDVLSELTTPLHAAIRLFALPSARSSGCPQIGVAVRHSVADDPQAALREAACASKPRRRRICGPYQTPPGGASGVSVTGAHDWRACLPESGRSAPASV